MKTTIPTHQVLQAMRASQIIPVYYNADLEVSWSIVRTCHQAGLTCFEFTNRGTNALEVFTDLATRASTELPTLILGAGTILDGASARQFVNAGAAFLVSPILSQEVALVAKELGVPYFPGCLSMTEMYAAHTLGSPIIKVFPGSAFGPSYIKAVHGPLPSLKLMPTGGVEPTEANLKAWFDAGVYCVGMGSQLFPKQADATGLAELSARITACKSYIASYVGNEI